MTQFCALISIVFMMSFVMVFDRIHWRHIHRRLFPIDLLSTDELDRLQMIMSACREA